MEFFDRSLSLEEIQRLKSKWGNYLKLTVDIEKKWLVVGGELHADGEKILLEKGSFQDDIWGGGIDIKNKIIDSTAILNLRPRLNNDSLEILDPQKREKFIQIIKDYFRELWN
jgi:hypothetical protein